MSYCEGCKFNHKESEPCPPSHEEALDDIEALEARVIRLTKALEDLLPAAVWFFEGPYGSAPDPQSLENARTILYNIP